MRRMIFPVLLASLAVFAGTARAGSVHGTVRDGATLTPIAGAVVTMNVVNPDSIALSTTTDATGAYAIADIPPGNEVYALTCGVSGYNAFYMRLPDPGSSDVQVDILLEAYEPPPPGEPPPDSSDVRGQVLTESGGELVPVAGARVTVQGSETSFVVYTDAQGGYALRLPLDTYAVIVDASGFTSVNQSGLTLGPEGLRFDAVLTGVAGVPGSDAVGLELRGAFPNPFRGATTVLLSLPRAGAVELQVFDVLGRRVATLASGWMTAGEHRVTFDGHGLAGGTYFCLLRSGGETRSSAVTVLK
jgi:hypothetical protein